MADFKVSREFVDFHLSPPTEKADPKYGQVIAEKMIETVKNGQNNYFNLRNERIDRNRKFGRGQQDMKEFLDLINIDGKESYVNLHMKPPPIAPKFREILIARFMERQERPTVTAVDDVSKKKKQRKKDEAEFRMHMQGEIAELEDGAGMSLEDKTAFTPEDKDELELHFETEDKDIDELRFEKGIWDVLQDGNYPVFKRTSITNIVTDGYTASKIYLDENKRIKYRAVQNQSLIYGYSQLDDFSDCPMIGELKKIKVSEYRTAYGGKEEDIYKMCQASNQAPTTDNISWSDIYISSVYRPYDDSVIEVFDFELRTTNVEMWLKKKDSRGRDIQARIKEAPTKLKDGQEIITKPNMVIYQGVYVVGSQKIVSWKLAENMIKPHHALQNVFGSYVVVMPGNEDMKNMAIVERMENSIVQMTTSLLKMQQLKSQLRPDENSIDISLLSGIDLGQGVIQPFKIIEMYNQTGTLVFNGLASDGETRQNIPVQPMPLSSAMQKMMGLMSDYNFHLQILRDMLGMNEASDGTGVGERTGLQVMNNQIGVSNRATDFIYDAYITLLNGMAERIAILLWWNITRGGSYSDVADKAEIEGKIYDMQITMLPTEGDRQYIEQIVQTALSAGLITFEEAFRIRDMAKTSVKLAQIYLAKYEKKRQQAKMQENQANIQATAQAQQQSNQQTHDNMMLIEQAKNEGKSSLQDLMNQNERTKMLNDLLKAALSSPETAAILGPQKIALMTEALLTNLMGVQQSQVMGNQTDMQNQQMMQQQAQQMMAGAEQPQQ